MRLRMDSRAKIHAFPQKDLIISDAEQTGIKYIGLKGMDEIYIYIYIPAKQDHLTWISLKFL